MKVNNEWVGYVHRSYQQIKDQVLTRMGVNLPEMTDHTESNPFVKFVSIFAGLTEHLNYWVDNTAREVHLPTARTYKSAVEIAQLFNYRLRGVIPATSEVRFTVTASPLKDNLIISIGTRVSTEDGIEYVTTREGLLNVGQPFVDIPVSQLVWQEDVSAQTSGERNQVIPLPEGVADAHVNLSIGTTSYTYVDNLAYSASTDTVYTYKLSTDGTMGVMLGDGVQGNLPVASQSITVKYALSSGLAGNVSVGSINRLVTPITEGGLTVSNVVRASGGASIESLDDLKRNIPLSNRTQRRAVTTQDYVDLALLVSGVEASGVNFKCGRNVDVYVVPVGGGEATNELLTSVEDYFEDKSMAPFIVNALSAGQLLVYIDIEVVAIAAYSNAVVEQNVRINLLNYFNTTLRTIPSEMHLGDVYEQIETTEGVKYSKVKAITIKPYARIAEGKTKLLWDIKVKTAQADDEWDLMYSSNDEFELLKNGEYSGTYKIGILYSILEIEFTIFASDYEIGDRWEFRTYPSNEDIVIREPNVFVLESGNINLKVSGGV